MTSELVSDICRVCSYDFLPSRKQKHRLFTGDLHVVLASVLDTPVHQGDGLPDSICSDCRNKTMKVQRLRRDIEKLVQSLKLNTMKTAHQVSAKRALSLSPSQQQQPLSKRMDIKQSPLSLCCVRACDLPNTSTSSTSTRRKLAFTAPGITSEFQPLAQSTYPVDTTVSVARSPSKIPVLSGAKQVASAVHHEFSQPFGSTTTPKIASTEVHVCYHYHSLDTMEY